MLSKNRKELKTKIDKLINTEEYKILCKPTAYAILINNKNEFVVLDEKGYDTVRYTVFDSNYNYVVQSIAHKSFFDYCKKTFKETFFIL